jgi:hypothetical protein
MTSPRYTVESTVSLDIGEVARLGLEPGRSFTASWPSRWSLEHDNAINVDVMFEDLVALVYDANGEAVTEMIEVERTPQHFGGSRPWWRCPECGGRCRKLHLMNARFRCRTCSGLTYVSSQSARWIRSVRKARHLGERAGRTESGAIIRPRYMHADTWRRRLEAYRAAATIGNAGVARFRARMERDFGPRGRDRD